MCVSGLAGEPGLMPTHPKCGKSWAAMGAEHCPACCETFNSGLAGDRHRAGNWTEGSPRRCLTVAEMREKGMDLNSRGLWVSALRDADSRPDRWNLSPSQGIPVSDV